MKQGNKRKKHTPILWTAGILSLVLLAAAIYLYRLIFAPFLPEETVFIYIDEEKDYEEVVGQLDEKAGLPSGKIFRLLAERMHYPNNVKSGRYAIDPGMTMPDVIRLLRSGNQAAVKPVKIWLDDLLNN